MRHLFIWPAVTIVACGGTPETIGLSASPDAGGFDAIAKAAEAAAADSGPTADASTALSHDSLDARTVEADTSPPIVGIDAERVEASIVAVGADVGSFIDSGPDGHEAMVDAGPQAMDAYRAPPTGNCTALMPGFYPPGSLFSIGFDGGRLPCDVYSVAPGYTQNTVWCCVTDCPVANTLVRSVESAICAYLYNPDRPQQRYVAVLALCQESEGPIQTQFACP
jgi:hypothetical protein